ncbi:MAG: polynucleotide adenylyltransferase, partial [Lachnospiraceae bacterium]|nr:polynucleotide adenylyltransferase [Lachnospiraceae bacterium]
ISTFEDIMEMGEPVYINDLVLTGSDLISLGAAEGPEIGEILNRMLDAVQKDPQINTIMYLISNFYKINKK